MNNDPFRKFYKLMFKGEPKSVLIDWSIIGEGLLVFGLIFVAIQLLKNISDFSKAQFSLVASLLLYFYILYFFEERLELELTLFAKLFYAAPIVRDMVVLLILIFVKE